MTVPLCVIDTTGIHAPSYADVLSYIQTAYAGIYGADVYLGNDSQDGQLLALFAAAINDANAMAVSVYNAFSPATAQGAGLSSNVKLNGLTRHVPTQSTAEVLIIGQAGTIITNGIISDQNDAHKWSLPASVTIPLAGQLSVTATAQELGALTATPNTLTKILNPTRGWQSVNNAAAATTGAPIESDADLRRRQAGSTALPARTTLAGVLAQVAAVAGVTRSAGYENDTISTDANGLPPSSLCIVALGGSAAAIASAIALKKPPGCKTHGAVSTNVIDQAGVPSTIKYDPLTLVPITINISITALSGYLSTTGTALVQALADFVSALPIGTSVFRNWLFGPANLNYQGLGLTYNVTAILIRRGTDPLAAADIAVAFNEAASCIIGDITLNVS